MSSDQVLEIDVGNSAFKWRLLEGLRSVASGRAPLKDYALELSILDDMTRSIKAVRIVSVAGVDFDMELRATLDLRGNFAEVKAQVNGVRCGYKDLNQLGVDRWMAILAAAEEFCAPLVVVDMGSATTVDIINEDKEHVGGYILPGWRLLYRGLLNDTAIDSARIPVDYQTENISSATTTLDAIGMGRLLMCAASINRVMEGFLADGALNARLVFTGGDALRIIPHIRFEAEYRPDLVLDGLRVALG